MSQSYLTVTALTKYIKRKIDADPHLTDVWLKGEISNFNHHSRGHMYMTIKDEHSRIQAVMFAGSNRFLKFRPENGMKVLIRGNISVFEPYGQYQLYIRQLEPDGLGSLHLAYEQLKEKLSKQGYFDQTVKKNLPAFPKHIGVITSPTGAAVRDIITTIKRRFPIVKTTIIPVQVQGEGAAQSISKGITFANEREDIDLLIVGRGGGSIEDLWAFNEEIVARAIFKSNIPIISAVGHETDTTISDFVADLRAPTPTGAAEIAVPSQIDVKEKLIYLKRQLSRAIYLVITQKKDHLRGLRESYGLRYPQQLIEQKEQQLDRQNEKLQTAFKTLLNECEHQFKHMNTRFQHHHPKNQLASAIEQVNQLKQQNQNHMSLLIQNKSKQFTTALDKMTLLNPLNVMRRGFTIPYSKNNEIIKSSRDVTEKEKIKLKFFDGIAICRVKEVRRDEHE